MSSKNNRPSTENPLANMGLDEIVRGLTSPTTPDKTVEDSNEPLSEVCEESVNEEKETKKRKPRGAKLFQAQFEKYARIGEQGSAIWIPKEVKKKLELICAQSENNIPIRSLATAIIMTYIEENEQIIQSL